MTMTFSTPACLTSANNAGRKLQVGLRTGHSLCCRGMPRPRSTFTLLPLQSRAIGPAGNDPGGRRPRPSQRGNRIEARREMKIATFNVNGVKGRMPRVAG